MCIMKRCIHIIYSMDDIVLQALKLTADPSEILLDDFDEDALPDDLDELEAVEQEPDKS